MRTAITTSPASPSAPSSARGSCRHRHRPGDVLIGLASRRALQRLFAGAPHRRAQRPRLRRRRPVRPKTLGEALLAPTRIYVKPLLAAIAPGADQGHGPHHRRRPGRNVPRCLPDGLAARLDPRWTPPPVFGWLHEPAGVPTDEMLRTFNCGLGLVVVVAPEAADDGRQPDGCGETRARGGRRRTRARRRGRRRAHSGACVWRSEAWASLSRAAAATWRRWWRRPRHPTIRQRSPASSATSPPPPASRSRRRRASLAVISHRGFSDASFRPRRGGR